MSGHPCRRGARRRLHENGQHGDEPPRPVGRRRPGQHGGGAVVAVERLAGGRDALTGGAHGERGGRRRAHVHVRPWRGEQLERAEVLHLPHGNQPPCPSPAASWPESPPVTVDYCYSTKCTTLVQGLRTPHT